MRIRSIRPDESIGYDETKRIAEIINAFLKTKQQFDRRWSKGSPHHDDRLTSQITLPQNH